MSAATGTTEPVVGELTIHTAGEQRASLLTVLESAEHLALDLAQVTELDTAGLQVLLLLRREAAAAGKTFSLTGHPQGVLDVLALANRSAQLADLSDPEQAPDLNEREPQ